MQRLHIQYIAPRATQMLRDDFIANRESSAICDKCGAKMNRAVELLFDYGRPCIAAVLIGRA